MKVHVFRPKTATKADLALFLVFPFVLLARMPRAWILSLWNARVLLAGRWSHYMGFDPTMSLNNLFYRTQWINLDRYGTRGQTPLLSRTTLQLSSWRHISLISSYIYANAGAVVVLFGTLLCLLSLGLLGLDGGTFWVLGLLLLILNSSFAFSMAFYRQNYQILGWLWIPSALAAMHFDQPFLAVLLWLLSSIFALTPTLLMTIPALSGINAYWTVVNGLTPLAGLLLIALYTTRPWNSDEFSRQAKELFAFVGLSRNNTIRYQRKRPPLSLDFSFLFIVLAGSTSCIGLSVTVGQIAWPVVTALVVFIVNERVSRIADTQSVYMNLVLWVVVSAMIASPSLVVVLTTLPVLYAPPRLIGVSGGASVLSLTITPTSPFDHTPICSAFTEALKAVPPGGTVFMPFIDPRGSYGDLFAGLSSFKEVIVYTGNLRGLRVLPNWWQVAQENTSEQEVIWCANAEDVNLWCRRLSADAVILLDGGQQPKGTFGEIELDGYQITSWIDAKNYDSTPGYATSNFPSATTWLRV